MLRDDRAGGRRRPVPARNVLGEALEICSIKPMTGFYRDGCCSTGAEDVSSHTVCAVMTADFLEFSKSHGNDLSTPMPESRLSRTEAWRPLVLMCPSLARGTRGKSGAPRGSAGHARGRADLLRARRSKAPCGGPLVTSHYISRMCGRVIQSSAPFRHAIVEGPDVRDSRFHNHPPRWNGAPSQELLVIRRNHKMGELSFDPLRWGLIPYFCADTKGGRKPISAKCETGAHCQHSASRIVANKYWTATLSLPAWRRGGERTPLQLPLFHRLAIFGRDCRRSRRLSRKPLRPANCLPLSGL
jgi:uncharacterized protein (DUF2237 family)